MIERFNFYDVYGYFLPGTATLAFVLAPAAISRPSWLPLDASTLLLGVPIAYLVGHLVQQVGVTTFRTEARDEQGERRYFSDMFLDDGDHGLSEALRAKIVKYFQDEMDMEISGPIAGHSSERALTRRDAFLLCRRMLIDQGRAGYVEQYQGMYTLMLGVATAGWIGASMNAGWLVGLLTKDIIPAWTALLGAGGATLTIATLLFAKQDWRIALWLLLGALAAIGFLLGFRAPEKPLALLLTLLGISLLGVFVARRCYASFRYFQRQFAAGVYRDFASALGSATEEGPQRGTKSSSRRREQR